MIIRSNKAYSTIEYAKLIVKHLDLMKMLVKRDWKLQYRGTILGYLWALVLPGFQIMMVYIVFGSRTELKGSSSLSYFALVLTGFSIWTFFSVSLSLAITNLSAQAVLISKLSFPRILLPASAVLSRIVDWLIILVITILYLNFFETSGNSWKQLYLLPILIGFLIFVLSTTILATSLAIRYRDLRLAIGLLMQTLLFATPVAYDTALLPGIVQRWIGFWPPAGYIEAFRSTFTNQNTIYPFIQAFFITALMAFAAWHSFRKLEKLSADLL